LTGEFDELQPLTDYSVSTEMYGDRFPVLELARPILSHEVLGVSYEETLPGGSRRAVGTVDPSGVDTIHVQLLQAPMDLLLADASNTDFYEDDLSIAPFNQVREFELRNVYDLQARNIDPATFHLEVRRFNGNLNDPNDRVIDGGKATSYLQILGLDLFHDLGMGLPQLGPDGNVDQFTYANFLDLGRGLVSFPDVRPFDPRIAGRVDARPEEDLFWKSRVPNVDLSVPGLRKLVLWPQGLANPPGSAESPTQVQLWSNPNVYDKRNQLPAVDRRYYLYAKFNGAVN
jgi:cell surface protein SprA